MFFLNRCPLPDFFVITIFLGSLWRQQRTHAILCEQDSMGRLHKLMDRLTYYFFTAAFRISIFFSLDISDVVEMLYSKPPSCQKTYFG